ncbi:MAG: ABC transporter ATP-binding protein [Tissierellia bacterium]|nr:ABC transporter ATP-binding protein [Tissierellia bacterium]
MNGMKNRKKKGLSRCLEIAKDKSFLVIMSAVLSSISAIASFIPFIAVYFIIRLILFSYPDLQSIKLNEVMKFAYLSLAGVVLNIISYYLSIICSHYAAFNTVYKLKLKFADHVSKIPLGYHLNIGSGRLGKIMNGNIDSIEDFIAHQFPDLVAAITAPIVMIIILMTVDWRFGLVTMLAITIAFLVQFLSYGGKEMKENMGRYQSALEEMNSASVEFVRGIPVLKAYNQTANSFQNIKKSVEDYTKWVLKFSLGWKNRMPAFTTLINNIYLIIIPFGIIVGQKASDFKSFSINFIFYLLFVPSVAGVLNKILYISDFFIKLNGNVDRIDEILEIKELSDIKESNEIKNYDIEFDNVSFSYNDDDNFALEELSFYAKNKEITAIVGPSGGGKSTIGNLISRFWDIQSGSIKIGDIDIRDIKYEDLMDKISFVFQDTFLFKDSIYKNISLGKSDISIDEVMEAAKLAQCHDFIQKLPKGYESVYGESGIHLSGGEIQRIIIARAILKNSPIIILDEATAFSDPENEYLIQKAFQSLVRNKTVIMIAHRLSTIKKADKIIVMEKGRLVEEGNHDYLIAKGGLYKKMWDHYTTAIEWKL